MILARMRPDRDQISYVIAIGIVQLVAIAKLMDIVMTFPDILNVILTLTVRWALTVVRMVFAMKSSIIAVGVILVGIVRHIITVLLTECVTTLTK